jgi:hypothetical protein
MKRKNPGETPGLRIFLKGAQGQAGFSAHPVISVRKWNFSLE